MTSFASKFEDETIGEPEGRGGAIVFQCHGDDIGILKREMFVSQQHVDYGRQVVMLEAVHRSEHPRCFGEYQNRYPCAFCDECLRDRKLSLVIARDESHQNVRVNGAHASSACIRRCPLSARQKSEPSAAWQIPRDEYLPRSIASLAVRRPGLLPRPTRER